MNERDIWAIWPGDFIKATDGSGCLGIVEKIGTVRAGAAEVPGYVVRTANGSQDFIEADGAKLVAPTYSGRIGARRLKAHGALLWAALRDETPERTAQAV